MQTKDSSESYNQHFGQKLDKFFENYLNKKPIFKSKESLQSNFTPPSIIHRDEQIHQIANIMAPSLRLDKPSNLFIYGKTGVGKTVSVKFTLNKIKEIANQKNLSIKIIYLNCKLKKIADTEYRLAAQLAREFGKQIPPTGLPTEEVYRILFSAMDEKKQLILLVLDEMDQLVNKVGDGVLYNLTRIDTELKNTKIALIGISNNLFFRDGLDPRVRSSLSEEEVLFPPYNALQIQDILRKRVLTAFNKDTVQEGVIEKCSAYAAREHGDARRALELLRVAGELAERGGSTKIEITHIDEAENKIEHDRVVDIVKMQPKQQQATLYSILLTSSGSNNIFTGEIYELYKDICLKVGLKPLTQRRISDVIAELDMLGIINAKVISKGRYGRTREISFSLPDSTKTKIKQTLESSLVFSSN